MMRKIIVAMVLMLGVQVSQAQTVSGLFREFRYKQNAEYMNVPKILMDVVKWAQQRTLEPEEINPAVEKINSMQILDLSECSERTNKRFASKVKKLKMKGYEPLITMTDNNTLVKLWAKIEGETISDIIMIATGNGDSYLCRFRGQLSMDDIDKVMEMR